MVYYNGKVGKSANAECKRSEYEDFGIWKFLNTNEAIECVEGNMNSLKTHRENWAISILEQVITYKITLELIAIYISP